MLTELLLPQGSGLRCSGFYLTDNDEHMMVQVHSVMNSSCCPQCHQLSERVHSWYERRVADLPWASLRVTLQLRVRRFFCTYPACLQKVFTERLPEVVAPWARRTHRLSQLLTRLVLMIGGCVGERLARWLRMPAGDDVLRRLVRQVPLTSKQSVRVLGVDDWALCRGQTYGTLLIDLEASKPIDLLPNRECETLNRWLQTHPEIELVTRDRSTTYAEAITLGAPQAQQVADRWHILRNLSEALMTVLEKHVQALKSVRQQHDLPAFQADRRVAEADALSEKPQQHSPRRENRARRFDAVKDLQQRGMSVTAIATEVGLDRKTVRKYRQLDRLPAPASRTRASILDPFKAYLFQRWREGCFNARHLFRELQVLGYQGGLTVVAQFVADARKASQSQATFPSTKRMTARRATWLILSKPEDLTDASRALIDQIRQLNSELETAVSLAQDFAALVRLRQSEHLDAWLASAATCGLAPFQRFASGIRRDYAAVKAGLFQPWSNGPVEGHINRLKLLKRQMYGRANFDLLRSRLLLSE